MGETGFFSPATPQALRFHGEEKSNSSHGEQEKDGGREHENGHQKLCARGHWRPAEDAKLKELVSQYGPQNWNVIAEKLEGRSGKSCRLRWFNQLDPRINRKAFSEEEEETLLAAHRLYGNKWALIARLFPGRTDNAVKNHWHVIMARKHRGQPSAYKMKMPSSSSSTTTINPPLQPQIVPTVMEVNASNNACSGESTITSTRDESASTGTDLSLSSTYKAIPAFLSKFSPPLQPTTTYDFLTVSDQKHRVQESCYFHYADSTSDASANDSNNALPNGDEEQHGRQKTSLPFIDFLGVWSNMRNTIATEDC